MNESNVMDEIIKEVEIDSGYDVIGMGHEWYIGDLVIYEYGGYGSDMG